MIFISSAGAADDHELEDEDGEPVHADPVGNADNDDDDEEDEEGKQVFSFTSLPFALASVFITQSACSSLS